MSTVTITDSTGTAYVVEVYDKDATETYISMLDSWTSVLPKGKTEVRYFTRMSSGKLSKSDFARRHSFLKDSKTEPVEDREYIFKEIKKAHNPTLVKQGVDKTKPNYESNVSPNSNIIYHLYNNGQITSQKGGNAYLQRSEFVVQHELSDGDSFDKNKFPIVSTTLGGYAIVTLADANRIRDMMITK